MNLFERYLTLWVALCIVAGISLRHLLPDLFQSIGGMEIAKVNLPVAVLIWLMIIPMLIKIDFGALADVGKHWRSIGVTLFVNWAVKRSQWRCWAGCSSALCSDRISPTNRSTRTSPD